MTTTEELEIFFKHCDKVSLYDQFCKWLVDFELKLMPSCVADLVRKNRILLCCKSFEEDKQIFITADSWQDYISKYDIKLDKYYFVYAIHHGHEIRNGRKRFDKYFNRNVKEQMTMREFNSNLGVEPPRQMDIFDFIERG